MQPLAIAFFGCIAFIPVVMLVGFVIAKRIITKQEIKAAK